MGERARAGERASRIFLNLEFLIVICGIIFSRKLLAFTVPARYKNN